MSENISKKEHDLIVDKLNEKIRKLLETIDTLTQMIEYKQLKK